MLNSLLNRALKLLRRKDWTYLQGRYRFTPRQLEIARLLCSGLDNNQIAQKLRISHNTVRTHIYNINTRVNVRNKVQFVLRMIEDTKRE